MKSNCYLLFFGLFFFLVSNPAFSQKPVLTDEDAVTETVTKEIDEVFKSEDFLKKKNSIPLPNVNMISHINRANIQQAI